MFLIFDTETTGLPRDFNAPLTDSDNWPRVVQVAWQLHDFKGNLINSNSIIVKPDGFTIPFNAEQVHGISTARALEEGVELKSAIDDFNAAVAQATYLCGHNIEFDLNIIGAEYHRLGALNAFENKKVIDTKCDETTEYCAIPGGRGGKFKWPTLTELYTKLFGVGFDEAHNAAFDVDATSKVFFEILKRAIISVKEVLPNDLVQINYIAPDLSKLKQHEHDIKAGKIKFGVAAINDNNNQNTESKIDLENLKFAHLHNHTQFSVLASTSDIDDLVKKAIANNMSGLAITDNGNMYGAFLFWQTIDKQNKGIKAHNEAVDKGEKNEPKKTELKAVIGCELNICKDLTQKKTQDNGYVQVFLAKNKKGYENLSKLSSIGFVEGFYYVPRVDRETVLKYKDNLIVTTGGLTSEIPSLILNVGESQAEEAFVWWHNNFGENFYVELNRHGLKEEDVVNNILLGWAKKYNVKYFAANNNYYLEKAGANSHDVLLCVKDAELKDTPIGRGKGFRYGLPNDNFYFKTTKEMIESFSDLPEALQCTHEIVSQIESFKLGRDVLLPKFDIPAEFKDPRDEDPTDEGKGNRGENAYLKHLTYVGAEKRYGEITPDIKERLDFELATIERMGFPGYFLIVSDFTTEARRLGVSVGPGRGSAAGSAIAYCLGITNVDPIKYDLLFERFLNPDRVSMPDIDIDFDDEGREKVISYVINKYGKSQVAQIITYGTLGGKSAIKDTARALNLPLDEANKLTKAFPESLDASLTDLLGPSGISPKYLDKIKDKREVVEQSHNFRKLSEGNTLQADVLKQAYDLEGCVRNTGTHACGIIITPDELDKFVPVAKNKDGSMLVTQFDNSVAESAGLLKMDFLGLRTLTIIKDALKNIKRSKGIDIDIDAIDLEDTKTYELFQRGETNGIFQFESAGMQKALKELKPDVLSDLIAMNALYRPGPLAYIPNYIKRKHGTEPVTYDLEGMDEYLKETHGITVYQEQVMRLSQKLANFTKGDADTLRKAMGKKQKDVLDKMKSKFLEGCAANNHDLKVAEKVWTDWEAFASYAFNKSHSTCYAYLAFQTAYLKAHYPAEFMASVLTHNMNDITKVTFFMEECKRMGLKVLGPDVNESIGDFSVNDNGEVRFGMVAIKGVGTNVVEAIVAERENGKFTSVFDMAKRLDGKAMNKKSIEAMALAGALDSFPNIHRAMFFIPDKDGTTLTEKVTKYGNSTSANKEDTSMSLFGEENEIEISEPALPVGIEPWGQLEQLAREKEVVGIYISGHPLDVYKLEFDHFVKHSLADLSANLNAFFNKDIVVGGIVTSANHRVSKAGKPFGSFVLEDYQGTNEFMLFGNDYVNFRNYIGEGFPLLIKGKVQARFGQADSLEIKISKIELMSELKEKAFNNIKVKVGINNVNEKVMDNFEKLVKAFPGKCGLEFMIEDKDENVNIKLFSKSLRVSLSNEFIDELNKFHELEYEVN